MSNAEHRARSLMLLCLSTGLADVNNLRRESQHLDSRCEEYNWWVTIRFGVPGDNDRGNHQWPDYRNAVRDSDRRD